MKYSGIVRRRLGYLLKQPIFWVITAFGNGAVLIGALLFQHFEAKENPNPLNFLDCLAWSVGMVTTVGYGSVNPATNGGKAVCIALMMVGSLFVWSYMALLVGALVSPDLQHLEKEIRDLESDLSRIRPQTKKN